MVIPKLSRGVLISIALALLLGVVLVGYKSCNLYDENSQLKGEMKAYKIVAEKNSAVSEKIKTEQTKIIGDMTKEIAVHKANEFKKNEQIKDVNKKLAAIESQYADLKTDAERVVNLTDQVNTWKDKFSLAEGIIKDKDGIIFSLVGKYDAQVKITEAVQIQLTDCIKLQTLYDDRISVLEKALKQARFVSKLKSWGGVALAAGVAYAIISRK